MLCMTDIDDQVKQRFFTAKDGGAPTVEQVDSVDALTKAVRMLASTIEKHVPDGRQKSIALTELESVQMRANRGVFTDA